MAALLSRSGITRVRASNSTNAQEEVKDKNDEGQRVIAVPTYRKRRRCGRCTRGRLRSGTSDADGSANEATGGSASADASGASNSSSPQYTESGACNTSACDTSGCPTCRRW